jgi:hypothetical protein
MAALVDGRKVVAAAGTREPLSATSVSVRSLTIQAETDNTGIVVIGGLGTVVAAVLTRRGIALAAGAVIALTSEYDGVDDLAEIGVDAMVNGDGVTYIYAPG